MNCRFLEYSKEYMMEFFEWISIPQFFMQFFGPTAFETKEALIRYYFSAVSYTHLTLPTILRV